MKLANGMGSVYKLSGRRRKPWVARKTKGWDIDEKTGKTKQLYMTIGYFPTRQEALTALINYNENPYDIEINNITFEEVYEKWSSEHFLKISQSGVRSLIIAFNHSKPLHKMRMKDIRANHLEGTIHNANVGEATKQRMKSLYNLMYRYCLKNDIVDKDYAALCESVSRGETKIKRVPFSDEEIMKLWDNITYPFTDMVLIGIYSGWRPQELAILKIADIDLDNWSFTGGLKTDAGRNRTIPIHPAIQKLVKQNYDKAIQMHSAYLFNDQNGQQGTYLTYDKYRGRFNKVMMKLNLKHKPHDTRHTFINAAKAANMNEYVLKIIVGHVIEDVTEAVYTHRTVDQLREELIKIDLPNP